MTAIGAGRPGRPAPIRTSRLQSPQDVATHADPSYVLQADCFGIGRFRGTLGNVWQYIVPRGKIVQAGSRVKAQPKALLPAGLLSVLTRAVAGRGSCAQLQSLSNRRARGSRQTLYVPGTRIAPVGPKSHLPSDEMSFTHSPQAGE